MMKTHFNFLKKKTGTALRNELPGWLRGALKSQEQILSGRKDLTEAPCSKVTAKSEKQKHLGLN